ncbi:hypothetical protein QZN11_22520 [Streptomyces gramineus]|uniref:hypothetical protein n=1 Tax=Streptomyces gramineus TaxID=910542 RepID=UPI00398AE6F8
MNGTAFRSGVERGYLLPHAGPDPRYGKSLVRWAELESAFTITRYDPQENGT